MNFTKKSVNFLAISTLILGLVTSLVSINPTKNIAYAANAVLNGNANGYSCEGGSSNRWKIETGSEATLPSGYSFSKVVVKAGRSCIPVYPTNTAPSCYSVSINGTTVTVTKIGQGPTCQDVSHLEGTYTQITPTDPTPTDPTPSEDPTPTDPTETPTDTPTPVDHCPNLDGTQDSLPDGYYYDQEGGICIVIECEDDAECEVVIGGSPTPTNTPTPTATNTPTPTPGSNGGSSFVQSSSGSSDGGSSSSSSPSVPAKAMASTGMFANIAGNISLLAGFVLSSLALPGYAKKKKKN